jgi:predicted metal-dependent HD superfamily phosphohydrolase
LAWSQALTQAGATAKAEEIDRLGDKLLERWANPARYFHNTRHLMDVLARVDELAAESVAPALVRLASFYHGAVFTTDLKDLDTHTWAEDEVAGAQLALGQLVHLGLAQVKAQRVHDLIIAIGPVSAAGRDHDVAVLRDAEHGILAAEPQRYRAYTQAIRKEHAHLDQRQVLQARARVLDNWLAGPSLYETAGAKAWESAARHNIRAERSRISKELVSLDA